MTEEDLIRGCLRYEHASQRELYNLHFSKMMHICIRYAKDQKEAKAILLNGFKNIFNEFKSFLNVTDKIKKNVSATTLEEWIKKEIITSAIQHMHNNKKEYFVSSTVSMRDSEKTTNGEISDEQIIKSANKQMILHALQGLTPSYRAIYNRKIISINQSKSLLKILSTIIQLPYQAIKKLNSSFLYRVLHHNIF